MAKEAKIVLSLADAATPTLSKVAAQFPRLASVAAASASAVTAAWKGAAWTIGKVYEYGKWAALGLAAALAYSAKKGMEVEDSQTRLAAVYQATAGSVGLSLQTLNAYADAAERLRGQDAQTWQDAAAQLMMFRQVQGQTFLDAMRVAEDLSAVLKTDLISSVEMLGKALEDPEKGFQMLRRAGVMFTDDQQRAIKNRMWQGDTQGAQQLMLQSIEGRVGGAAGAMADTTSGHLRRMWVAIENIAEGIGQIFLEPLSRAADAVRSWCEQNQDSIVTFAQRVANWAEFAAGALGDFFSSSDSWSSKFNVVITSLVEVAKAGFQTIVDLAWTAGAGIASGLASAMTTRKDIAYFRAQAAKEQQDFGMSDQWRQSHEQQLIQNYLKDQQQSAGLGAMTDAVMGRMADRMRQAGQNVARSAQTFTPDAFNKIGDRWAETQRRDAEILARQQEGHKGLNSILSERIPTLQKQTQLMQQQLELAKSVAEQFSTLPKLEQQQVLYLAQQAQKGRGIGTLSDEQTKLIGSSQLLGGMWGDQMQQYLKDSLKTALGDKVSFGESDKQGNLRLQIDLSPEAKQVLSVNQSRREASASRALATGR